MHYTYTYSRHNTEQTNKHDRVMQICYVSLTSLKMDFCFCLALFLFPCTILMFVLAINVQMLFDALVKLCRYDYYMKLRISTHYLHKT